ncbi:MAG: hypothetical protein ACE37H_05495 [Phycisphaeraceae bacterium]
MPEGHPEYQIHLKKCADKSSGTYTGVILADKIGDVFKIKSIVPIEIDLPYDGDGKGVLSLDSFIHDSINFFLEHQQVVIDATAKALFESFQNRLEGWAESAGLSFDALTSAQAVWGFVSFKYLKCRTKINADPETIESLLRQLPNLTRDDIGGDDASTTTYFALVFECQWDEEHIVVVDFVNGECEGASTE